MTSITVEAIFENGVLRPIQPLPLVSNQQVRITVQLPKALVVWPENVAAIYQEIAEEDRRLASTMFATVAETWPTNEESP